MLVSHNYDSSMTHKINFLYGGQGLENIFFEYIADIYALVASGLMV